MESDVVRVTEKGQATIPVELRARHGITAPGLVRFVERNGRLTVEAVRSPDEMMGVLKGAYAPGQSAAKLLLRDRQQDKAREARKFRGRRA